MTRYALPLPCLIALLLFATVSCTETTPTETDVAGPSGANLAKHKPGHGGGGPGGGGGDSGFTNWAFAAAGGSLSGTVELVSSDGGETKTLVQDGSIDSYWLRFTADGTEVAYNDGNANTLRIVGVDGSNDRVLLTDGSAGLYDWLPGSSHVIYASYGVFVVDTTDGLRQSLDWESLFPDGGSMWNAAVSAGPDLEPQTPGFQGPIIAGWSGETVEQDLDLYVVELREAAGSVSLVPSTLVRLALPDDPVSGDYQNYAVFSPDGSKIAYLDKAHCCAGKELKVVDFDIGAWDAGETSPAVLFGTPVEVASPARTASLVRISYQPTWAPDGSWIAFQGLYPKKGQSGLDGRLTLVRFDGSETIKLSSKVPSGHPDWSPVWCNDIDNPGEC